MPLAAAGAGTFLAAEAGRRLGVTVLDLALEWGKDTVAALPARAAAYLLAQKIDGEES